MWISRISEWLLAHRERLTHGAAVLLTTVFYVAAFPPFNVGESAFVCFVPFVLWLRFNPSYKLVFWTSLAIGWVSWLVLIFWLRHVTWGGMAALSGIMGLYFSLWALGTAWLSRRTLGKGMWSGIPLVLGSGALWVIVEHLRSWLLTGFGWLPLAASQWKQPIMLQSATEFGQWSVSFALVILNVGVAGYFVRIVGYAKTRKKSLCPEFYVALSIMVWLTFMQLNKTSRQEREPAFKAAVVQPAVPQDEKWNSAFAQKILDRLERQSLLLKALEPDAVFWPEAVLPYPLNDDSTLEAWTLRLANELEVPLFAGALGIEEVTGEEDLWYNSVFLVEPKTGLFPHYYSKRHLVPFGEYIPLRSLWPWIETVVPLDSDIFAGEDTTLLPLRTENATIQVGSLICFEDVFPALARQSVEDGAGMLFVATNSAWYGRSGASQQHMAHSVLRAVETRRVVLRVGNDGWSCWIDEYGHVVESLGLFEQEWTAWDITRDRRWVGKKTPYVERGDVFVWACYGLLALCVIWIRVFDDKKARS